MLRATIADIAVHLWFVLFCAILALPCARPLATMTWAAILQDVPPRSVVVTTWLLLTLLLVSAVLV